MGNICARWLGGAFSLLAAGTFAAAPLSQALADPIPVKDLARLPQLSDVSLSPDGRRLVALVPADGEKSQRPALSVWNLDAPQTPPLIAKAGSDVEFIGAAALKSGRVLAVARKPYTGETFGCDGEGTSGITRTYTYKLFFADDQLKKFEDPFDLGAVRGRSQDLIRCFEIALRGDVRTDLLPLDPENVVVAEFDLRTFRIEYKKYNLRTDETELIFKDSSDDSATLLDPRDATVLTRSKVEFEKGEFRFQTLIRNAGTGSFDVHDQLTWDSNNRFAVSVVGRDEKTGKFYVVTDRFRDKAAVYMYDPAARKFDEQPAFAHPDYEAAGIILGHTPSDFNQLLGFRYGAEIRRVYWVDPYFASAQKAFETALPGRDVTIIDYSNDRSKLLIMAEAANIPPAYYLLADGKTITKIGDAAPWIDIADTSPSSLVYYAARDGVRIPALLTPPAGWEPGDAPPPAIVMPHGGPWARDYADWDTTGWVQFFASRGYAVLQPQYRGSAGWGRDLWVKGHAQWGLKMQDDKDDGARWLASAGYADPERIAIFGYSYGGFAAFAAAVREDGPFKCAIAGAGVSDLTKLSRTWSENNRQRYLQGRTVRGMNPIDNVDKLAMPILIIHGDRDVRVPIGHSRSFYRKIADKEKARLVEIKDMPHSLPWTPAQKEEMLNAVGDFLDADCRL